MSDYLDPSNEELLKDFFDEAQAQVELLEENVLLLEHEPDNQDAIDEIFRAAHTLKGGAATVEMTEIAEFTHLMEDVLDEIRSGNLKAAKDVIDKILDSLDIVKNMLEARASGITYSGDISETIDALKSFLGGQTVEIPEPVSASVQGAEELGDDYDLTKLTEELSGNDTVYKVTVRFNPDYVMNTVGGIQVYAALKEVGTVLKSIPEFEELYEDNFFPEVKYYCASSADLKKIKNACSIPDVTLKADIEKIAEKKEEATEESVRESAEAVSGAKASSKKKDTEKKHIIHGSMLRVDSKRIDDLLNLVSETVINKATFNQVNTSFMDTFGELQNTQTAYREQLSKLFEYISAERNGNATSVFKRELQDRNAELSVIFDNFEKKLKTTIGQLRSTSQNLSRITSELQEGVMRIRMVPVSHIFSRFPRLIRDLSGNLKKKVLLQIEGEETELDKSVIEDLLDPLIHCVRNSVDHGIEMPGERKKAGKEETGRIILNARNEGNMIIIEISDDGRGINVEAVKKKAVERGLIHPDKDLTEIEAFNLIFEPGFSTASKVTNISGRGVGLDVVRKQIEKLNGVVSISSERGKGTKFTIRLPLTLAIVQGLMVKVGRETYAIPITSVVESHRIKPEDIRMLDSYEVFDVRKDVLSILRLNRLFKIPAAENKTYYYIVIVGTGEKKVGLMVDSLIGEEDVVIKPLRDRYTNSPGIAGATILGDGTVSLILDVNQLLELGLKRERDEREQQAAVYGKFK
ncbi:MAG: chemotaxis protein CheA [Spirochaetes bacterium]|nr:chemotaxis protein CheA [Spirochaetota bacterium]